jgi:hypothetical protein
MASFKDPAALLLYLLTKLGLLSLAALNPSWLPMDFIDVNDSEAS